MIREVTENDAGAIAEIYNYYIRNTAVTFEEDDVGSRDIIERIGKVRDEGLSWLVAEENEKVIGYAYATKWRERTAYRHSVEVSVYLLHTDKSRGWGTRLYEALFSRLREQSVHVAIGGVTLPNPASVAMHEKLGMEKVAHFKQVGYKFGEWLDVGYWQKLFTASPSTRTP